MGNALFGIDIAGFVADAIGPQLLDATLIVYTSGARDPQNLTAGPQRSANQYTCKGFWEDYSSFLVTTRPENGIEASDRKAVLIGDTIPAGVELKEGDQIEIEGFALSFLRWESRDPAGAVYVAHCRDQRGSDGI